MKKLPNFLVDKYKSRREIAFININQLNVGTFLFYTYHHMTRQNYEIDKWLKIRIRA